MSTQTFSAVSE